MQWLLCSDSLTQVWHSDGVYTGYLFVMVHLIGSIANSIRKHILCITSTSISLHRNINDSFQFLVCTVCVISEPVRTTGPAEVIIFRFIKTSLPRLYVVTVIRFLCLCGWCACVWVWVFRWEWEVFCEHAIPCSPASGHTQTHSQFWWYADSNERCGSVVGGLLLHLMMRRVYVCVPAAGWCMLTVCLVDCQFEETPPSLILLSPLCASSLPPFPLVVFFPFLSIFKCFPSISHPVCSVSLFICLSSLWILPSYPFAEISLDHSHLDAFVAHSCLFNHLLSVSSSFYVELAKMHA